MNGIQNVKPESFGKGKKKGKKSTTSNAKFYLKAYLTSTQHKGSYNVDLRTLDVRSIFQSHFFEGILISFVLLTIMFSYCVLYSQQVHTS